MTILADACSLILLAKVGILETFVSRNKVVTSELAYQEAVKGKEKGRMDSILIEKLVQENKIKLKNPKESIKSEIRKMFNLKAGELEVISLAYKKRNIVLSDDKKCLNAAKALGISFVTSLDVIAVLLKHNVINKKKAMEYMENLEEYGWYTKELIKYYKEAIK